MRKGEITAFLSLVFVLLLSFISGIIEASAIQVSKNLSRLDTDRAIYSIFGEYQKQLLEQYHIFAIEGSYGTGDYEEDSLIRRMHYYGNENIQHEITGIQYLTDNNGQTFREQVLEYMEQRYGIELIRELSGMTAQWEEQQIQGEEMGEKQEYVMREIEALGDIPEITDGGNTEGQSSTELAVSEGNPFTCMEKIENEGILSVVLPKEMTLSGKETDIDSQVSYRNLRTGRGSFPSRSNMNGIEEKLLFGEYILKEFGNAAMKETDPEQDILSGEERSLDYEVEYILAGKASDKDNLESVLFRIFLIRMALNYVYLMKDTVKQGEAQTAALAISALLLMPEAVEAVKQIILVVWAAGESILDIRTLLSGQRAAFMKNAENWQLSIWGLFNLGTEQDNMEGRGTQDGLSYEDYLRILLFLENTNNVTMRTLDRVEENISRQDNMDFFKADQCVSRLELQNTVQIYGNLTYQFPVSFGYE